MSSLRMQSRPVSPWRYQVNRSRSSFRRRSNTLVSLDSPTVSLTQINPPWPKPRPKWGEPDEPDPSPVPSPPPTPPPAPPPEGEEEEAEEEEDEDLDEEQLAAKKAEELLRKLELEEERRRAECPPMPPPFPPPTTPEPEEEPRLREPPKTSVSDIKMREILNMSPAPRPVRSSTSGLNIDMDVVKTPKRILPLQDDAIKKTRRKATKKAAENAAKRAVTLERYINPPNSADLPNNFLILPDTSAILRGSQVVPNKDAAKQLPFTSILAIITSFKYKIDTWTKSIVDFVVTSGVKLCVKLQKQHYMGPSYILPKISIGHESYKPDVKVMFDGSTWRLEETLKKYLPQYDRGIITTYSYSCAFYERYGYFYLFDGSNCNSLGVRTVKGSGKACFLRFPNLHSLVNRILANKDVANSIDQQFVLTRVIVQIISTDVRFKLSEKYDFNRGPENLKFKTTVYDNKSKSKGGNDEIVRGKEKNGYQSYGGVDRIVGSTALPRDGKSHFVCVVAMLLATMHPLRYWDSTHIDLSIEKGIEITKNVKDFSLCEKRVIKNLFLDGKFFNLNIRKILVINENEVKTLEQYVRAVLHRLRYVIIIFPNGNNLVISRTQDFFNVFDCFSPPIEIPLGTKIEKEFKQKLEKEFMLKLEKECIQTLDLELKEKLEKELKPKLEKEFKQKLEKVTPKFASWTRYSTIEALILRLGMHGKPSDIPQFFNFEVTTIRRPPHQAMLAYKLTNTFKTAENPNLPYLQQKTSKHVINEKLSWVTDDDDTVPWSPELLINPVGLPRRTLRTLWQDWNIEFPGDLCSVWGKIHPTNSRFPTEHRGQQYLACCMVALVLTNTCRLFSWTSSQLDGIVIAGDKYHETLLKKIGNKKNYEISCTSFDGLTGQYGFYTFTPKSNKVIFGFVYNILPDRFNLSQALQFFFEKEKFGILESVLKNLAFGKVDNSYFMFDCQTRGSPVFSSEYGDYGAYALKCETLNMLVYCMTVTLNATKHNELFHLYSVELKLKEKN